MASYRLISLHRIAMRTDQSILPVHVFKATQGAVFDVDK
jgi:hypothetical protein